MDSLVQLSCIGRHRIDRSDPHSETGPPSCGPSGRFMHGHNDGHPVPAIRRFQSPVTGLVVHGSGSIGIPSVVDIDNDDLTLRFVDSVPKSVLSPPCSPEPFERNP